MIQLVNTKFPNSLEKGLNVARITYMDTAEYTIKNFNYLSSLDEFLTDISSILELAKINKTAFDRAMEIAITNDIDMVMLLYTVYKVKLTCSMFKILVKFNKLTELKLEDSTNKETHSFCDNDQEIIEYVNSVGHHWELKIYDHVVSPKNKNNDNGDDYHYNDYNDERIGLKTLKVALQNKMTIADTFIIDAAKNDDVAVILYLYRRHMNMEVINKLARNNTKNFEPDIYTANYSDEYYLRRGEAMWRLLDAIKTDLIDVVY
jgi:hypothetical protein